MYNEILTIGPVTIHGYGLMIAIGIVAALAAGIRLAKRKDVDPDELYNLTFIAVIGGFMCAKVLYCIVEWKSFIDEPLKTLGSDGFVVYGGIIGGTLLCGLYCRFKKLSFFKYFDIVLPSVAIAQGFGRIGCFLAGCCYGRETDSFVGITFHNSSYAPNNVSLIPTQLFSSAGCFLMAAILFIYARKEHADGRTGALYLIMYSIGRSIIEIFRNDFRGEIGILSTSQFISIFILLTGIVIYFRSRTSPSCPG
ncbi:MAG: prolipoprotein diacylglyceryl transferase [Lachnospiraceae bacterium]|nr:prolipoprotein diacylglyceryl transferase [Lachnospiraceae bacterium]